MLCSNQLSYIAVVLNSPVVSFGVRKNRPQTIFSEPAKGREFCRFTSKMSIPVLVDNYISHYSIVVCDATAECLLADLLVVAVNTCMFPSVGYYRIKSVTDYS